MIISNLPFPSLSPQAAKALKGNIYNRRQPVHLGGNHCAADDAERQGKDRRASSGAGPAQLPPLPECGQAYVLCLETGPDTQSETARFKKNKKKPNTCGEEEGDRVSIYVLEWTPPVSPAPPSAAKLGAWPASAVICSPSLC